MECQYFGECGSCVNYEGGYDAQLSVKKERLKSLFSDLYNDEMTVFESPQEAYRARSEFKLWHVGDDIHYGMNSLEYKGVVLVEACPQVATPIALLMPRLIKLIAEKKLDKKLFGLDFLSSTDGAMVVSFLYHRPIDETWDVVAKEIADELQINIIGRARKIKRIIGQDYVLEDLNVHDTTYRFRHIENSFTQPNPRVNEKMLEWALDQFEGIGGDLLEMYCGAGNFTIPFATKFDKVLATEIAKSSINAAKENMRLNDIENIEFLRMSAQEFVQALDGVREFRRMKDIELSDYTLESIFVDPPRSGLDEESCAFTARFDNILYISCNPETLKRDLDIFTQTHEIQSMAMFDQFPYTFHIEMGVMLKRKVK